MQLLDEQQDPAEEMSYSYSHSHIWSIHRFPQMNMNKTILDVTHLLLQLSELYFLQTKVSPIHCQRITSVN